MQKYIWVQIAGMSIFLSWPVAMMLADMYDLACIIPQMSVLLITVAEVVFCIGLVGRQEFKGRENDSDGR